MNLIAAYRSGETAHFEVYESSNLSISFDKLDFSQLQKLVCQTDDANQLTLYFTDNQEGIATLKLNGNNLYQKEKLSSKRECFEAVQRYFNGKFGYKVYYSFETSPIYSTNSSFTTASSEEKPPAETAFKPNTNILDDIDFNRPIFKPHVEEKLNKTNRTRPQNPSPRPSQPRPRTSAAPIRKRKSKSKSNTGIIIGIVLIIGFLSIISLALQNRTNYIDHNNVKSEEDIRRDAYQDYYDRQSKRAEERRQTRRISSPPPPQSEQESFINDSGVYEHPAGKVEILSMTNDGAQQGFILLKVKNLETEQVYFVYNAQDLPESIQIGSRVKTEYLNLSSGLDLKHPVVYIDL